MHWFIDPIKNHYADFEGRIGRQEYWMYVLIYISLYIVLSIIGIELITVLFSLGLLVPNIALVTRRLHDTGRSGWWQLLGLIPLIGAIILIVWLATKTINQDNMYGKPAVPKAGPEGGAPVATATPAAALTGDSSVPMASTTDTKMDIYDPTPGDSSDGGSGDSSN